MHSVFRHVALFGKPPSASGSGGIQQTRETLEEIGHYLDSRGCDVVVDAETSVALHVGHFPSLPMDAIGAQCDLGLVVGGDGTMLGVGRRLARWNVPLVGINQGRLGFITDIALDAYAQALEPMLRGEFEEDRRSLMDGEVLRDGASVFRAVAMNDVVVYRGGTGGMVELRVEVDGAFVANQRADGLIIASPTGSTAYALSAGGALLHPSVPGWLLVPIAPHTLSNRPLVLADAHEVSIELVAGRDASANFDMQSLTSLLHGDRIRVRRSEHAVRFLHPKGWTWFDTLRRKLHWNAGNG